MNEMVIIDNALKEFEGNKIDFEIEPKRYYVYALYQNDSIVYIGQTVHLHSRIAAHKRDKTFDGYSFVRCKTVEEMDILESELIVRLQPKYNGQVGNSYISTKRFRQIIKDMAGERYNSSMYINRIREHLVDEGIEIVNFKGSEQFNKKYIDRAIKKILG